MDNMRDLTYMQLISGEIPVKSHNIYENKEGGHHRRTSTPSNVPQLPMERVTGQSSTNKAYGGTGNANGFNDLAN